MRFQQLMATHWMYLSSLGGILGVLSSYKGSYFRNFTKLRHRLGQYQAHQHHWKVCKVEKVCLLQVWKYQQMVQMFGKLI
uniref:Uncharacterized protein n=1 Tax=Arundo donax TaxID=35708 RepID=A0A0A9GNH0_ARUDO